MNGNKENNKIQDDSPLEEIMGKIDVDRYKAYRPAINNTYYRSNLLTIIDKLPEIQPNIEPKLLKINPINAVPKKQPNTDIIENIKKEDFQESDNNGFKNIVMAYRHEVDGIGNQTKINQYQVTKKLLGKGSHCFVKLAKKEGKTYAIKTIALERLKKKFYIKDEQLYKMINNQISILLKLDHPNIIKLEEAIYSKQSEKMFLILENCLKDLSKAIRPLENIPYEEWLKKCQRYCREMASALKFIHDNQIIHRDIKSENVLIDEHDTIKVIDFNVSMKLPTASPMITVSDKFVGTKAYGAPEIVIPQQKTRVIDGKKVDVWALGITFYELVQKNHPWTGKTIEQLIKFLKQPISFRQNLNPSLKDLLQKMLRRENSERITMDEVIRHPWIQGQS